MKNDPKQFPTLDVKIELQQEDEEPEPIIVEDDEPGEWGD